jgi:hypothetical protein
MDLQEGRLGFQAKTKMRNCEPLLAIAGQRFCFSTATCLPDEKFTSAITGYFFNKMD